ncbi:MAG: glyoxalase [Chloroflexi bacterium]|nr:glyoxalase [Chloroflexota bacterium]
MAARIGHVHLKVSDLDRALEFYRGVIGLDLVQLVPGQVAFMAFGGYHHHVALNVSQWRGAPPAPATHAGMLHAAFSYPSRQDLGAAYLRAVEAGVRNASGSDHGITEAIYFDDPDGNGVEISWDCPPERWQYLDGGLNVALGIPFDPNERFLGEVAVEPPALPATADRDWQRPWTIGQGQR